jgi:hypothetical protein
LHPDPPGRSVYTFRILVAVLAAALSIASCTDRTLPLPPPVVDRVSAPNAQGLVTLSGYALEGASIGVINDRTLEGVIAASSDADCAETCPWEARIAARGGDVLRVWQFFGTEGSKDVSVPRD